MTRRLTQTALLLLALAAPAANADKGKNVLDIKTEITDSSIVFPESYETDTRKMLEGWYMKNYTATDDRYKRQGDVQTDDATIRERLAKLPTLIEMPYNQIVRSYIDRYTQRGRAQVAALLGLNLYYMPIFEQALEQNGLPLELKYLPVIESGLDPNAVSKHGASGLWQFMIGTAKGMGLEVSSLVDERRDPYASSAKAAQYLKDLFSTYGDWPLAIAAYNCGPGTVNKALRRAGGDSKNLDFWAIYYYLPEETRGYLPMFIAANYVMNYYPHHNISPVLPTKPLVTDTLMISDRVHFDQISHVLNIPMEELRILNPQFRADIIPGTPERPYTLVLPSQQCHAYLMSEGDILAYEAEKYARRIEVSPGTRPGTALAAQIEREEAVDETPLEETVAEQTVVARRPDTGNAGDLRTIVHKVTPGQTLSRIATLYNVSADDIKEWNSLQRNAVRTGQMLRITTTAELAEANGAREVAPASQPRQNKWSESSGPATKKASDTSNKSGNKSTKSKQSAKARTQASPKSHTVRSGENLSVIARRYGVSVKQLQQANGMKGTELHPGDKLKLPAKGKSTVKSRKSGTAKKKRRR